MEMENYIGSKRKLGGGGKIDALEIKIEII